MINTDLNIKEKFVEMCKLIFINGKKQFIFPFDDLIHDDDWSNFTNHSDWSLLEKKMSNLINLVNSDNSLIEKDVENELWDMV